MPSSPSFSKTVILLKKQNLDLLGSCSPSRCGSCVWVCTKPPGGAPRSLHVAPVLLAAFFGSWELCFQPHSLPLPVSFLAELLRASFGNGAPDSQLLKFTCGLFMWNWLCPRGATASIQAGGLGCGSLGAVSCASDLFPFIFWTPSFTSSVRNATPQPFKPQRRKTVKRF